MSIRARRMLKERDSLGKETAAYVCFFNDEDIYDFTAYIIAPEDSVYRHKLIKLVFTIPERYPLTPPAVKFIQHRGGRLHPNLYTEGRVCLSILGTWPGEPWAFCMTTDSVLRTIQSLLDNEPYSHEPNQKNIPEYNEYVRFNTWRWLLLDYLEHETNPAAKAWLQLYIAENADKMIAEVAAQQKAQSARKIFSCKVYGNKDYPADYPKLLRDLETAAKDSKPSLLSKPKTAPEIPDAAAILPHSTSKADTTYGVQNATVADADNAFQVAPSKTVASASNISQGGSSAKTTGLKRKATAKDDGHGLPGPSQSFSSASKKAKVPTAQEAVRSPTRLKKSAEVIDLTEAP